MVDDEKVRRYVQLGTAFTQSTRARLEQAISDLTKAGQPHERSVQQVVDELLDWGRQSAEAAVSMVRTEIARQLEARGVATMDDLANLASRLTGSERGRGAPGGAGAGGVPGERGPEDEAQGHRAAGAKKAPARRAGGAKKAVKTPERAKKTTEKRSGGAKKAAKSPERAKKTTKKRAGGAKRAKKVAKAGKAARTAGAAKTSQVRPALTSSGR